MKKTLKMVLLAAVIAVAVASCSDRPKVIPARKMEKIYREMFMADQWIIKNPEKKRKAIGKTFIGNNATFISHMKFATIEALLMNRAKSLVKMSSEVFMKRMRQLNYDVLYENPAWENRRLSTTVY